MNDLLKMLVLHFHIFANNENAVGCSVAVFFFGFCLDYEGPSFFIYDTDIVKRDIFIVFDYKNSWGKRYSVYGDRLTVKTVTL
ncbi:hypothetical protein PRJBM_01241 [Bartonella henselae]|uniref:hypothetical protein n=1 Tax=Bartonella henselae TaxID=38323 RepID=UPI0004378D37|nr:hypothetical protein [Bartonella henselae]PNM38848.1 hypothetical protein AL470_005730 [Bartonella henselae str. Houston-1]ATP12734.1 hypothetical protein BhenCHDE101_06475 [Bartonella henselae]OLL38364.1 hypothetical protein AT244_01730 [Bartonella henselae]OLL42341.1 hypothetical protein AT237_04155 [Bartonella henselae]OLL46367.1 hypothetical protein AT242_07435 [Bartonella henselae]